MGVGYYAGLGPWTQYTDLRPKRFAGIDKAYQAYIDECAVIGAPEAMPYEVWLQIQDMFGLYEG